MIETNTEQNGDGSASGGALISDTDIVSGYMWLLGRVPSESELAGCRTHFGTSDAETVRSFQGALLDSVEFRNRRLSMRRERALARPGLDGDRLAFIHIEKCGGTTLNEMLCSQFEPEQICPERHSSIGDWTINELAGYRLFSGHFDLAYCRSIPGHVRIVTMLREPKARLFSLYRFWKSHRPDPDRDLYDLICLARQHDAEAFFAHEGVRNHTALRDGMAGQLTRMRAEWRLAPGHRLIDDPAGTLRQAKLALDAMDGFGILERFEQSRSLLNRQLGLSMPAVAPRQVLSEMVRISDELVALPPEPMTPRLEALLDAMTTVDRLLYAHALALFERRVTAMAVERETPGPAAGWVRPLAAGWRRFADGAMRASAPRRERGGRRHSTG